MPGHPCLARYFWLGSVSAGGRTDPRADLERLVGPANASFANSLVPMLIADDSRRYVQVNRAACLLLRLPREAVLQRTIDDLTPPENRGDVESLWDSFLRDGTQSGRFELLMPDGPRMWVDYSATANVRPGLHLSIFLVPVSQSDEALPALSAVSAQGLTEREREVLTMIAMGESGTAIAAALAISPATVETHVRHCLEKLAARNRAHAIAVGLQRGEIGLSLDPRAT